MPGWLQAILIAVALVVASWLLLIVLARRLPPGLAKDLAAVPARLRDRRAGAPPGPAGAAPCEDRSHYRERCGCCRPIDLIPEFLPVIGPLDDVIVVALLLRYAGRSVPRQVLLDAWPGDPYMLGAAARPGPPGHVHGLIRVRVSPLRSGLRRTR